MDERTPNKREGVLGADTTRPGVTSRYAPEQSRLILRYPPKKTAIFFNERFMAARHQEGAVQKQSTYIYLITRLSNDEVRVPRGAVFQEIRPGAVEHERILQEKLGGGDYHVTTQHMPVVSAKTPVLVSAQRLKARCRGLASQTLTQIILQEGARNCST